MTVAQICIGYATIALATFFLMCTDPVKTFFDLDGSYDYQFKFFLIIILSVFWITVLPFVLFVCFITCIIIPIFEYGIVPAFNWIAKTMLGIK